MFILKLMQKLIQLGCLNEKGMGGGKPPTNPLSRYKSRTSIHLTKTASMRYLNCISGKKIWYIPPYLIQTLNI